MMNREMRRQMGIKESKSVNSNMGFGNVYKKLNFAPDVVYHLTKVENAKSIISDGELKVFAIDGLCWLCDSFEKIQKVADLTVKNVGGTYINKYGLPARYGTFKASDYVVLKIKPIKSKNWVKFVDPLEEDLKKKGVEFESANKYSIAHIDNLKLQQVDVYDLDGNTVDLSKLSASDKNKSFFKENPINNMIVEMSKQLAKQMAGIN